MRRTILLTATIEPPPGAHKLARSDPSVRRRDYLDAFTFYVNACAETADRVVLAENSGADLRVFRDVAARTTRPGAVVVLGYALNDFPPEWGRAYGEFRLLDAAMRDIEAEDDEVVWKVTGRIRVANITRLLATAPSAFDLYCDCRRLPRIPGVYLGKRWMDMRLFAVTTRFYGRELVGRYESLRHDLTGTPEPHFYNLVRSWEQAYNVVPRFRSQPHLVGFAGYDNKDLASVRQRALNQLRAACRRLVPFVWI